MASKKYKKAIVFGAGISGMIQAKVLSESFEEVVIYEKEAPLQYGENRRSTPHSFHGHILWKKGEQILNSIFPNFTEDLIQRGAFSFNAAEEFEWYHNGLWKVKYKSSIQLISQSRSLLETYLQEKTMQTSNIRVVFLTKVQDVVCAKGAVTEIILDQQGMQLTDSADFYLDTTGNNSKFLENLVGQLPTKSFEVNLTYLSAVFHVPEEKAKLPVGITYVRPRGPQERKGGGILRIEQNRWLVTLYGYDGEALQQSTAGFLEAAAALPDRRVHNWIKDAVLDSEVRRHKVRTVYCRTLQQSKFPSNYLVGGDVICRLDPVFGQGITMSCIYADILRRAFGTGGDLSAIQKIYCTSVNAATYVPWQMAKTEDFRYPGIKNERSIVTYLSMKYSNWLFPLIATDPSVCERFLKVINLLQSPIILFSPIVWLKMIQQYFKKS